MVMCLPPVCDAFASSSLSSLFEGLENTEPISTPEASGPALAIPGGITGNRPGSDGQGVGEGPIGPRQPPPPNVPIKRTPPGENNIPREVEPDGSGQPVKAARAKLVLFPAYLQAPLGQRIVLDAQTYPAGKNLVWTSLDPSVATVDADGCVTPVAVGETYVLCALADDARIAASCGIRVTAGGNLFFWEYTPEPEGSKTPVAEAERMNTEEEIVLQALSWPGEWPDEIPRMEGKIVYVYDGSQGEYGDYGLVVAVSVEGKDAVEEYLKLLTSMSFQKGAEYADEKIYYMELSGKGYRVMVTYDYNEKMSTLMLSK